MPLHFPIGAKRALAYPEDLAAEEPPSGTERGDAATHYDDATRRDMRAVAH